MLGTTVCAGVALSLIAAACGGNSPEAVGTHHHRVKSGTVKGTTTTSTTTTTTPSKGPTAGSAPTAPPSSVPVATVPSAGFQGIYEFAGDNSAADASDPALAGVVLVYYWSQIEPEKGVFDWSQIQSDMAPWVAAHKKVILRISTSGAASWDPPYSGDGTPAWVYADGARSVSDNGETLPVYWDQAYLDDYQSFVQSFGAQFDGNPNIAFIEPGIGMGGETLPETDASTSGIAAWESDGYSDALWLSTVEKISTFFETPFKGTPIYPLVDRTFFDGDATDIDAVMAWFKAQPGWGLQNDGLSATQTLSSEWSGAPLALEQLNSTETSGDCLCSDISNGLDKLHGSYLLIYKSDIDNPTDAGYLSQAAAAAR